MTGFIMNTLGLAGVLHVAYGFGGQHVANNNRQGCWCDMSSFVLSFVLSWGYVGVVRGEWMEWNGVE